MVMKCSALIALCGLQHVHSVQVQQLSEAHAAANPIRKVVNMLEMLKKKVEAEGEAEEQLFKRFMCYCSGSGGDLQKGIDANNAKVPQVQSAIEEAEAQRTQLNEDLTKHRADREGAKAAMAEATAIRDKEAATFAAYKAEADSNIAAIKKAVTALESGMTGFLQTTALTPCGSFCRPRMTWSKLTGRRSSRSWVRPVTLITLRSPAR